jgi:hypothetical protein
MPAIISQAEYQKLNQLKELDLQVCSFCHQITILNLGWEPFVKLLCQACQEEHVLCPELCLPVAKNIFDCHLYVEVPKVRLVEPVEPNRTYDKANCYLCSKELAGASKKGVIKNRNNPSFWGLNTEYKILCLGCVGERYLRELSKSKRRTFNKYLRRGYV